MARAISFLARVVATSATKMFKGRDRDARYPHECEREGNDSLSSVQLLRVIFRWCRGRTVRAVFGMEAELNGGFDEVQGYLVIYRSRDLPHCRNCEHLSPPFVGCTVFLSRRASRCRKRAPFAQRCQRNTIKLAQADARRGKGGGRARDGRIRRFSGKKREWLQES